jgi:putative membrane protein
LAPLDVSTKLAIERTRAACDRTMMAWIRTGTSLISFGFAIFKFFQLELPHGAQGNYPHYRIGTREFALIMVVVGMLSLLMGTVEYRRNIQALRKLDPDIPRSLAGVLAGLIFMIGTLALVLVIYRQ